MKLTNREKMFIGGGAFVIVTAISFLLYQKISPMVNRLKSGNQIFVQEKVKLYELAGKYQSLRRFRNVQQDSGNLSAEVESYLNQYGLLGISSLNPSQEEIQGGYVKKMVRISMTEANITQVLQFVKAIEDRQGYRIELFQSRAVSEKKPGMYSVKINIAAFDKA